MNKHTEFICDQIAKDLIEGIRCAWLNLAGQADLAVAPWHWCTRRTIARSIHPAVLEEQGYQCLR